MSSINIALLGYGTVGKGVYKTIESHQERLQQLLGKPVKVVAILVQDKTKHIIPSKEVLFTTNFDEITRIPNLHIVIDAIVGKEPGFSYLKIAIEKGCHVITANKEMFAFHGSELQSQAKKKGVSIGFEATVAGGVPVIQTIKQLLQVNHILKVEAILNGTSNFILSNMRIEGTSFEETLQLAKEHGYAEADPTNDIQGYDAFYKGMVLSQLIFQKQPSVEEVKRKGITNILAMQIEIAESAGLRFKHIVSLFKQGEEVHCKVEPVLVTEEHPFYQVEGVQNSVSIATDLLGNIQLQGPGAGMFPTASAVLEDLIQLNRTSIVEPSFKEWTDSSETSAKWVLFCDTYQLVAFQETIHVVDRIHKKAVVVESKDEVIASFQSAYPDIEYYALKGPYESKVATVSV
ncbi:homoserine dehydrogenase [Sutcliffiella halmapala]|uniref:homoserine dehydrogenase n=1 Tax=Sutcliffiella halmapala TaxID=79882 RepID=UPI000995D1C7|nr:homoserine dehydrogenase [Sutcliffiella halmapala]